MEPVDLGVAPVADAEHELTFGRLACGRDESRRHRPILASPVGQV
jgi:hypothetical protein